MKQKNLDELRNIYLGLVTGGEGLELLSEAPNLTPFELSVRDTFSGKKLGDGLSYTQTDAFKKSLRAGTPGNTSGTPVQNPVKSAVPVKPVPVKPKPFEYNKTNLGTEQDAAFRAGGGNASVGDAYTAADVVARGRAALKAKAAAAGTQRPAAGTPAAGTPAAAPVTQRPAASGPVLSKLKGVEGTGVGANFKAKAFNDTERTRYSSVAAAKPAIPTGTTAGGTTFQRRAATGDELRAAQDARAAAKAAGDTKGAEEAAVKAGVNASKPSTPTPNPVKANVPGFALGGKPTPTPTPAAEPSGETDRLKKALDIKKSDVTSSYQFPMSKTLRDLSDSYNEIYEAKKQVDQDEDGDNDFADNMIARMVASGMSREEAIKKVKNKNYNKKNELDEGIGSAIRGLFGRSKPKQSRGEELRSKYGSPARFGRPPRTPSGEKTKTRYDITLKSSGKEAADKVHGAAFNMLGIAPRDDGSHNPGTVTSGQYRGMGNRANRRMNNPPEDTRDRESEVAMGIESKVKRGHIDSRGVKKPLARSTNAEEFELWVNELIEEGYDLSEYTWDEMSEIYFDEATAMSKRGLDEPAIRNQIASQTRGGSFADKATALADKETYGDKKKKEGREKLARTQRGTFRDTNSSSPGLRGYGYKSSDPAVKAKQDARGNQRARAALTPNERKQLNMEYDLYDLIQSHLLEYGFADTEEGANMIIENMSPSWIKQILSED